MGPPSLASDAIRQTAARATRLEAVVFDGHAGAIHFHPDPFVTHATLLSLPGPHCRPHRTTVSRLQAWGTGAVRT